MRIAELLRVEVHENAKREGERAEGSDNRPWARIDEMIVVLRFRVGLGHLFVPLPPQSVSLAPLPRRLTHDPELPPRATSATGSSLR